MINSHFNLKLILHSSFASIFLLTTVIFLNGCDTNIGEVNKAPEENSSDLPSVQGDFVLFAPLNINLSGIEEEVNRLIPDGTAFTQSSSFEAQTPDLKTKNPAYNPNKWLKTKNPLYEPKKWIKAGPFKTKNPTYNPKKWIKTKNPAYNPNQWIYTEGPKIDIGVKYDFEVSRGEINLSSISDDVSWGAGIRVKVPVSINGDFGFKGDIARLTGLNKKNARFDMHVQVDLLPQFTENWCPDFDVRTDIEWVTPPSVEIIDDVWFPLDLRPILGDFILNKKTSSELKLALNNAIECSDIRASIENSWQSYSFPLESETPALSKYSLNVVPQAVWLSDATDVDEKKLRLVLGIQASTEFSTSPAIDAGEVPNLEHISDDSSGIAEIRLPIKILYSDLASSVMSELTAQEFEIEAEHTPKLVGKGKVHVTDIRLFPSQDRLAIAISFKAKFKRRLFNTKGVFYLVARPSIEENVFALRDVEPATEVDNPLYPVLLAAYRDKVAEAIELASVIDLSVAYKDLASSMTQISSIVSDDWIDLSLNDVDVGLQEIVPSTKELIIVVSATGEVEVDFK